MMIQDQYSGYVHEVPDQVAGYGEPVYDGFGNPVGFSPLFNTLRNLFNRPGQLNPFPYIPSPMRPWPLGWIRSSLPYTGLGPQRMYMRCAVWPGPRGLVPAFANAMQPGAPGMPGLPGMPGVPGLPAPGGGGRHRRRRRRR